MKLSLKSLCFVTAFFSTLAVASAAGIDGKWTSQFDTQIGVQKYTYEFKTGQDGKITGKAQFERGSVNGGENQKGTVDLKDVKVAGSEVSFAEPLAMPGMPGPELIITYTGTISGDEITMSRKIGDFATEQLVAKRAVAEAPAAKPAAK
jgi:hypothetical protein